MDDVSMDQVEVLDRIYHKLIFISQQKDFQLFNNRLKDVTTIEISILEIVENNPDIILKDIIEELRVPSSTLTNAINRLEKRNLIKRVISQRDRRSYGLELTEEGKLAQKEHKEGEKILYKKILNPLTRKERDVFLRCLNKITNNFCRDRF